MISWTIYFLLLFGLLWCIHIMCELDLKMQKFTLSRCALRDGIREFDVIRNAYIWYYERRPADTIIEKAYTKYLKTCEDEDLPVYVKFYLRERRK